MNVFSIAIILVIISFGIIGMKRGFLKELVTVVGTVLVFVLAFMLKDYLAMFLTLNLPAIKITSSIGILSTMSVLFYQLISFLILVIIFRFILQIILSLSGIFGKILDLTIILALPNKLLGLFIGLLEGYIIAFIALNILMIPLSGNNLFMSSKVRGFVMNDTPVLKNSFGGINLALNDILTMEKKDENTANLSVVDTLLRYNIVSPSYIIKIKENNKIDDVSGIDEIINKYKED